MRNSDVQRLVETMGGPAATDPADVRRREEISVRPDLTPRQWEILHGVAAGATNRQIGHRLGVSEATVRKHLEHVFERLHVSQPHRGRHGRLCLPRPDHPWADVP